MNEFSIDVGSDQDHEDLVAEVYFDNEFVGMLTQEAGFGSMEVVIYPRGDGNPWTFRYEDFLRVLREARDRLWELRRSNNE